MSILGILLIILGFTIGIIGITKHSDDRGVDSTGFVFIILSFVFAGVGMFIIPPFILF